MTANNVPAPSCTKWKNVFKLKSNINKHMATKHKEEVEGNVV